MFGGAAGGGKSDAMLMDALQFVDVPGYAALLLRRTFPELTQASGLIPRSHTWAAEAGWRERGAKWNENRHTWTFPSGAVLMFGAMQYENDKHDYQSGEYQYVGFEELTSFTETQYTYLLSRVRRLEGSKIPVRVRSSSNPGGVGHEWVRGRFILPAPPNVTHVETELIDGVMVDRSMRFIPSLIQDNPSIDKAEYLRKLSALDPVTREQLLRGNWDVVPKGDMFDRKWFHMIDQSQVPALVRIVLYVDRAATEATKANRNPDWTVLTLMGMDALGRFYVLLVLRFRKNPADTEDAISTQARSTEYLRPTIWIEQEPGSSGKDSISHYQRNVLAGYTVYGHRVTGNKAQRAEPFSAAAKNGHVYVVRGPWNRDWFNELEQFPNPDIHDDQVDSASGAHNRLVFGTTGGTAGSGGQKRQTPVPDRVPKQGSTGTISRRR